MIELNYPNSFDDDDQKLFSIAIHFLTEYFNHTEKEARLMVDEFISSYLPNYDIDWLHHDSSYRLAVLVHYLCFVRGDPKKLPDWEVDNGYNIPPAESFQYFREHYFIHE